MKRITIFSLLLAIVLISAGDVLASYRVTGTFQYRDREQDHTGFTGNEPLLPIRGADVEVLDNNTSAILGTGVVNASGEIDIFVNDNLTRDIVVRVLTWTDYNPFLNVQVETWTFGVGNPYSVESSVYTAHNPTQDLDVGTVNAEPLGPAEPFNIFDCLFNQMSMVNALTGVNPGGYSIMRARFTHGQNPGQAYYTGIIHIGADFPWDDGVILHEGGHFTNSHWSFDNNPGGTHYVGDVNQDPRLSYGEGMGSYWSSITAAMFDLIPRANLNVNTTGAPGPGHLSFYLEYEQPNWGAYGPACESAVTAVLYDMHDDETWPDLTPGVGEDFDLLNLSFEHVWNITFNHMTDPTIRPVTVEDFWDKWMLVYGDTAYFDDMQTLYLSHRMEFWEDDFESDDTKEQGTAVTYGEDPGHHTLFPVDDLDWYSTMGMPGAMFQVGAANRQPATHALVTVYESDGVTIVADNSGNVGASVSFVTDDSGLYYVKVNQHSFTGIYTEYGAYDMDVRLLQAPDDSAAIQVTPSGIVVPGMMVGTTTEKEFTINNNGGGPLKVTVTDHERYVAGNPPAQWISESTDTATVGAGGSLDVTAFIDATGLHPDTTYDAIILISSNDMINPEVEIIVRVMTIPVGIGDDDISGSTLPKVFALNQNYPNPFNPSTSIVYDVPEAVEGTVPVRLTVYNTRGQMVKTLVDMQKAAGQYTIHWDGTNSTGDRVSSGIYFYKISAGDFVKVKKMVLLK